MSNKIGMKMSKYKDDFLLLGAGIVCAIGAWLFWFYAKENGFSILALIATVTLLLDNRRLRKLLAQRELSKKPGQPED